MRGKISSEDEGWFNTVRIDLYGFVVEKYDLVFLSQSITLSDPVYEG